jgi:hypothetical protein
MKTTAIAFLTLFTIVGCAPSTKFYAIRPFPRQPKSENAQIEIIGDPPGKPYQFLGVVTSSGLQTEFIGNTQSSTAEALVGKAREVGADALVHSKVQSASSYSVGSYGVTESQQHFAMAYAIAWASPTDSTFIPGNITCQSIIEKGEDDLAKKSGKVSMGMLRRLTVGETKLSEVQALLGEPVSESTMDMGMVYLDTKSYAVDVLDMFSGSKRVIVTLQFNKSGVLSSKMIS